MAYYLCQIAVFWLWEVFNRELYAAVQQLLIVFDIGNQSPEA